MSLTLREAFDALLDGKKIQGESWDNKEFICLLLPSKMLVDEGGGQVDAFLQKFVLGDGKLFNGEIDADTRAKLNKANKMADYACKLAEDFANFSKES